MPTLNQLVKKNRKNKEKKTDRVLGSAPQRSGLCQKVYKSTPKKPNSGQRSCAKVLLTHASKKYHKHLKKEIIVYIPGEGHNLKQHSKILIAKGNVADLPGVKYKAIRGQCDLLGVPHRVKSRSKMGTKKQKKTNKKK